MADSDDHHTSQAPIKYWSDPVDGRTGRPRGLTERRLGYTAAEDAAIVRELHAVAHELNRSPTMIASRVAPLNVMRRIS